MDKVTIRPDELLHNADWSKTRWDLPTDANGFLTSLGIDPGDPMNYARRAVADFMEKKPSAEYMPNQLRQELAGKGLLFGYRSEPNYRATAHGVNHIIVGALRVRKSNKGKARYYIINKQDPIEGIRVDPDTLEPLE